MTRKKYTGYIDIDGDGLLNIVQDDKSLVLADLIKNDFNIGDNVSVKYYILDKEKTEEEATDALLKRIYGDIEKLNFILEAYSEWTIEAYSEWTILDLEEEVIIGGHDLIEELSGYEGKYLILIIRAERKK